MRSFLDEVALNFFLVEAKDLCSVYPCFFVQIYFSVPMHSLAYQRFSAFVKREYLSCLRTVFVEAAKKINICYFFLVNCF